MRHKIFYKKLNRTSSHRMSMLVNMTHSCIEHEQIYTTLAKAKALRPYLEKIITFAKKCKLEGNIQSSKKSILLSKLRNNKSIADKLVDTIAPRYLNRSGGYTRIIKANFRNGDAAPMAYIQLIDKA